MTDNHSNTQDDARSLRDEADTLGNALAVLEKARVTGLDGWGEEIIHRRANARRQLCEIDDAGGFTFASGLSSASPRIIRFTPQETVALWEFWRVLGYAEILLAVEDRRHASGKSSILDALQAEQAERASEASHE